MNLIRDKILKYGSCFLVLILPVVYFNSYFFPYVSSKTFFLYGFVEILATLLIYSIIFDKSYRLSKRTLLYFLPLLGFVLWMSIAGILAVNPILSLWGSISRGIGLFTIYHLLALSFIVASIFKREGLSYLYKLFGSFLFGGFLLSITVWLGDEGFHLPFKFLTDSQGGGLMGNSSIAAAYLLFVLAIGVFLLTVRTISKNKKIYIGIATATILFSPLFVNIYGLFINKGILGSARGAVIGIIVGIFTAIFSYLAFSKNKTIRILGILSIILSIFIFFIAWNQLIKPNTTLHNKFVEVASGTRFIFWDSAQSGMNKHPWFGYGPENYSIALQENFNPKMVLSEYLDEEWVDRAHNIYFDTGSSGGYPAIILYGIFLSSIFYGLYCAKKNGKLKKIEVSIIVGLITGYIFQNLFVFDSINSLLVLFVLAGIIYVLQDNKEKEKNKNIIVDPFIKNSIAIFLLISCSVLLAFVVYKPIKEVKLYSKVFNTQTSIRLNHYNDLLEGYSIGAQWDLSWIAFDICRHYISNPTEIKNDKTQAPYIVKDISSFLDYLEIVSKQNTTDARLYIEMIYLYNALNYYSNKSYDQVLMAHILDLFKHAQKLAPSNPQVYWSMAQAYIWAGDFKSVEQLYLKAISLDSSIPESHQLLIRITKAIGDQKMYTEAMAQAQKDIPDFKME